MEITTTSSSPDQLITDGQFNFGRYTTPIPIINMMAADIKPAFLKNIQLREWQAFQCLSDDHFFFGALYNTKKIGLVQFIIYDINSRQRIHYERKVAPWEIKLPNGLFDTRALFRSPNCYFQIEHNVAEAKLKVEIDIKAARKTPAIYANLVAEHDVSKFEPVVVCLPFSKTRAMYAHKCLMPVEGDIAFGASRVDLKAEESHFIIDDHKGFYPYISQYDWATGMGFSPEGQRIGFNLTDNQIKDQKKYNENVLWLNGQGHPLPPIKFYRPEGDQSTWYIRDENGIVDLTFTPQTMNRLNLNLVIMKSKYAAPYGFFNGHIQRKDGQFQSLVDIFGVGEAFYLRG